MKLVIEKVILSNGKESKLFYIYEDTLFRINPVTTKGFKTIDSSINWIKKNQPKSTFRILQLEPDFDDAKFQKEFQKEFNQIFSRI